MPRASALLLFRDWADSCKKRVFASVLRATGASRFDAQFWGQEHGIKGVDQRISKMKAEIPKHTRRRSHERTAPHGASLIWLHEGSLAPSKSPKLECACYCCVLMRRRVFVSELYWTAPTRSQSIAEMAYWTAIRWRWCTTENRINQRESETKRVNLGTLSWLPDGRV